MVIDGAVVSRVSSFFSVGLSVTFPFVFVIFRLFLCGLGVASHITADQTAEMQENRENREIQGSIFLLV